jgi:hypothetical protein
MPERPATATEHVFVVLKGPRRGAPLTSAGLDEIVQGSSSKPAAVSAYSAVGGMLSARMSHDVVPVRAESPVVVECEY